MGKGAQSLGTNAVYPGNPLDSSPIEPNPTAWWLRPVSSAARVREQSAVTWKRLYRNPASAMRVKMGVYTGLPKVPGLPKPASSISTSSTLGAPSGGSMWPIWPQSGFEPASVRLMTPWNGGRRIGSLVRFDRLARHDGHSSRPL